MTIDNYHDGSVYNGLALGKFRHGNGTLTYKDGSLYNGSWENDQMKGLGTFQYANGDQLKGRWADNMLNGDGVFVSTEKKFIYEGTFKNSLRHGQGTEENVVEKYDGQFNRGRR